MTEANATAKTAAPRKKNKPTFEEMNAIHENWLQNDKTGTQAAVFSRHGWTRTAFFNESYKRLNPEPA